MPTTLESAIKSVSWLHCNVYLDKYDFFQEIPAGILQQPFFDDELPFAMNFGGIGVVIGHELTHAFDNNGAKYDGHGHPVNWWTPETLAKFNERGQCFKDQYGSILDPLSGMHVSRFNFK